MTDNKLFIVEPEDIVHQDQLDMEKWVAEARKATKSATPESELIKIYRAGLGCLPKVKK